MRNVLSLWTVAAVALFSYSGQVSAKEVAIKKNGNAKRSISRIVGGTNAKVGEFSSIVSLHSNAFKGHVCGGTLISEKWILTAAHCMVDDLDPWTTEIEKIDFALAGLHSQKDLTGVEKLNIAKVYLHPKYNDRALDYDYALVELVENSSFKPAPLNRQEISITSSKTIMSVTAGWGKLKEGWGASSPDILQRVSVPLVSKADCNAKTAYDGDITDRMLCAGYKTGGKDACQGDSGGPLYVEGANGEQILAGIVSWGAGCARPNKYGVYSKVNAVLDWIHSVSGL